jgi:hypothetical protein
MANSSNPPKSQNGTSQSRNAALTVCGIVIASQIPTTLSQISDPVIRGCAQLLAVIIVFSLGYYTTHQQPRKP